MRNAGRGEAKVNDHVLRECEAAAEDESRAGYKQDKEQVWKINQGDSETILFGCSFDFNEECHGFELDF